MTKLAILLFVLGISLPLVHGYSLSPRILRRSSATTNPNVTILMMFPDIDSFIPNLKSLRIVYEYIVHRYQISKWLNIHLQVEDSNCSISLAPHMLVKSMLSAMPDVVFGPFCGKLIIEIDFSSFLLVMNRFSCCTSCSSTSFPKYPFDYHGGGVQ